MTPLSGLCVLLVEDEPDLADLFMIVLQQYGAEVLVATTAAAGLQALDKQPDVLVCNIRLPDLDGRQLLKLVRAQDAKRTSRLPAIGVTSYTRDISAVEVSRSGFDRFLYKPLDAEQLVLEILALVGQ